MLFEIQSVMIESEYRRSRNERFAHEFQKRNQMFQHCLSISRSNSRDLETFFSSLQFSQVYRILKGKTWI